VTDNIIKLNFIILPWIRTKPGLSTTYRDLAAGIRGYVSIFIL
jgi:hypothetical protein